ncbi:MAG: hypothetical protein DIU78_014110 [Pseudomonadota bacterium]
MNDALPLIEEGVTPFEMELLLAGRRDAMSPGARERILAGLGLGIGSGVLVATTAAAGVEAAKASGLLSSFGFGAAASTLGAIAVWAGASALLPESEAPSEPPPAPAAKMAPASLPVAPAPPVTEQQERPAPVEPIAPAKPAPRAPAVASAADSLALELAAIDRARTALSRGDAALALRLLDDYAARFGKGSLNSEATVLRIEALTRKGDRDAAVRLGTRFLADPKSGPYARRVRSLLRDTETGKTPAP